MLHPGCVSVACPSGCTALPDLQRPFAWIIDSLSGTVWSELWSLSPFPQVCRHSGQSLIVQVHPGAPVTRSIPSRFLPAHLPITGLLSEGKTR